MPLILFMHGACSKYEHCIKDIHSNFSVCFMIQVCHNEDYSQSSPCKRGYLWHSDFTCHFSHLSTLFTLSSNMIADMRIWFTIHEVNIKVVVMPVEASGVVFEPLSTMASILVAPLWLYRLILQEFWAHSTAVMEQVWKSQHPV